MSNYFNIFHLVFLYLNMFPHTSITYCTLD
nr:MAG TPA: hypothetical protein [Caudoviricetes sp.]